LKKIIFILITLFSVYGFSQGKTKIEIIHSDFVDIDQTEVPDAVLHSGNVQVRHEGAILYCNKAYLFTKTNQIKVFGSVNMIQGDTLFLNSKYAEYDGNTKIALAKGDVVMRDSQMTLTTDQIHFDRTTQQAYYNTGGKIINADNTLTSISGTYFAAEKVLKFRNAVEIVNPQYVMNTDTLDYNTFTGEAIPLGPTTIKSDGNFIYTERGIYNTKTNISNLTQNSYIIYDNKRIEGDSIYYDRNLEFASATNNVKITDTINKTLARGNYAEVYQLKDSVILTKRALVATEDEEKDTLFTSAQRIIITGKKGERVIRAFKKAQFYKTNMSGKADSIHSDEVSGITKLIGKPVVWNGESQMTGDLMLLLSDKQTQKLDSIKVLNNVFIVEKDTLGTGYNQVKGQNLFGKFRDGKLSEVEIIKNTEMIYYTYSEGELYGIDKNISSKITMTFVDNEIETVTFHTDVKGDTYPESELPENARKLRGFIWRGDERITSKEDVIVDE